VAHRSRRVADLEQANLAEIDVGERMADERIGAYVVDLDVEDAAATGGTITVCTPVCGGSVRPPFTQARSSIPPTT